MTIDNIEPDKNVLVGEVLSNSDLGLPPLMTSKKVKEAQDKIHVSLKRLDMDIHANAVQCLMHAEKHGDTSLMRRLLVDIIDEKSGYRRQGLIAWMKTFSPMRLTKDNINLSGMVGDVRQPFRVDLANKTPFTMLAAAREMVPFKPIFKDSLTSKIERALKEYKAAIKNTLIVPGQPPQPIELGKPFYDGIHLDKMEMGFDQIERTLTELLSFNDATAEVRTSHANMKRAMAELQAAAGDKQPL